MNMTAYLLEILAGQRPWPRNSLQAPIVQDTHLAANLGIVLRVPIAVKDERKFVGGLF
jgi:hypothetical protein